MVDGLEEIPMQIQFPRGLIREHIYKMRRVPARPPAPALRVVRGISVESESNERSEFVLVAAVRKQRRSAAGREKRTNKL